MKKSVVVDNGRHSGGRIVMDVQGRRVAGERSDALAVAVAVVVAVVVEKRWTRTHSGAVGPLVKRLILIHGNRKWTGNLEGLAVNLELLMRCGGKPMVERTAGEGGG